MNIDKYLFALLIFFLPATCLAHADDDPLLWSTRFDAVEIGRNNFIHIENDTWIGKDLKKLWIKMDIEKHKDETESAELQVLYKQAIAPNWDVQVGLSRNFESLSDHTWALIGVTGLSPYFFEIDTALYFAEKGRVAFRLEAEYEILFTQKFRFTPGIELNFYGQNEKQDMTGSGLSSAELEFNLSYHLTREFAPYIGVSRKIFHGNTADFRRGFGEASRDSRWLVGFQWWY